jgi:hypothetical protein
MTFKFQLGPIKYSQNSCFKEFKRFFGKLYALKALNMILSEPMAQKSNSLNDSESNISFHFQVHIILI